MKSRYLLFLFLVLTGVCMQYPLRAQDSLYVIAIRDGYHLVHEAVGDETVFTIAKLYHAPPAMLKDINRLEFQEKLGDKDSIRVPVGMYNQLNVPPAVPEAARPLYYRVDERNRNEDLYKIAWRANVSPEKLRQWNRLKSGAVSPGMVLLIGWVAYDTSAVTPERRNRLLVRPEPAPPVVADSGAEAGQQPPAEGELERQYLKQIQDGGNMIHNRGTAVFFRMPVRAEGGILYAFHDEAPRGTVIRVLNPGTGRVVYAKVLGPLPKTRQYHNAMIGLSDRAAGKLGVREGKAWCELSYTGY